MKFIPLLVLMVFTSTVLYAIQTTPTQEQDLTAEIQLIKEITRSSQNELALQKGQLTKQELLIESLVNSSNSTKVKLLSELDALKETSEQFRLKIDSTDKSTKLLVETIFSLNSRTNQQNIRLEIQAKNIANLNKTQ